MHGFHNVIIDCGNRHDLKIDRVGWRKRQHQSHTRTVAEINLLVNWNQRDRDVSTRNRVEHDTQFNSRAVFRNRHDVRRKISQHTIRQQSDSQWWRRIRRSHVNGNHLARRPEDVPVPSRLSDREVRLGAAQFERRPVCVTRTSRIADPHHIVNQIGATKVALNNSRSRLGDPRQVGREDDVGIPDVVRVVAVKHAHSIQNEPVDRQIIKTVIVHIEID